MQGIILTFQKKDDIHSDVVLFLIFPRKIDHSISDIGAEMPGGTVRLGAA